jgi:hypothetical protein
MFYVSMQVVTPSNLCVLYRKTNERAFVASPSGVSVRALAGRKQTDDHLLLRGAICEFYEIYPIETCSNASLVLREAMINEIINRCNCISVAIVELELGFERGETSSVLPHYPLLYSMMKVDKSLRINGEGAPYVFSDDPPAAQELQNEVRKVFA